MNYGLIAYKYVSILKNFSFTSIPKDFKKNENLNLKNKIIFTSNEDTINLYKIDPDGKNKEKIINSFVPYYEIFFTPNLDKIVFEKNNTIESNKDIYVINNDGSSSINLIENNLDSFDPDISPNGKEIVFSSKKEEQKLINTDIYKVNIDGTALKKLTEYPLSEEKAKWSPDNKKILFLSGDRDSFEKSDLNKIKDNLYDLPRQIYLMDSDGDNEIKLTNSSYSIKNAIWSRNGKYILFISVPELYVMNNDGTNQIQLTNLKSPIYDPDWSPDNEKIVFQAGEDLYIIKRDGTNLIKLADHEVTTGKNENTFYFHPLWSPDGTKIIFTSSRWGGTYYDIYTINSDGTDPKHITNGELVNWKN